MEGIAILSGWRLLAIPGRIYPQRPSGIIGQSSPERNLYYNRPRSCRLNRRPSCMPNDLSGPGNSFASFCGTISLPSGSGPNNSAMTSSKATPISPRGSVGLLGISASRKAGSPSWYSRTYLRCPRVNGAEESSEPNSSFNSKAVFGSQRVVSHRF